MPKRHYKPEKIVVTHEGFYRAFEDRYRGSRELIRSRLRSYLPFIEPLKSLVDHPTGLDLGCGRGEWLQLLSEYDFDALGVDLDDGMLTACYENGLRATKRDAIEFLQKLPTESQCVVSGFHIAEHLAFPQLQMLVQEALRVLKPAGLLILETPNPENVRVSSLSFYYDPTHRHPIPSELLTFLSEYYGFWRTKLVRLQENANLLKSEAASLNDVLGGVSPDYAVIAQKAAANAVTQLFDRSFEKEFGLSYHVLVERFDRRLVTEHERIAALGGRLEEESNSGKALAARLDEECISRAALEARLDEESNTVKALAARLDEERDARMALGARLDEECIFHAALEARLDEERNAHATLEARLVMVYTSTSWRITAPLRSIGRAARWFVRGANRS